MKKMIPFLLILVPALLLLRFIDVASPYPAEGTPKLLACTPNGTAGADPSCAAIEKIKTKYLSSIKPIFEKKCQMCHGVVQTMPLYSIVPPSSLLVRKDVHTSRKHLDMTFDYPFGGKHNAKDNLKSIKEEVTENEMPPWQYKIMHPQSGLTDSEKKVVLDWIEESAPAFKNLPDEED